MKCAAPHRKNPFPRMPMTMTDDLRSRLAAPFAAKDIEWRIARSGIKDSKPWGMCLAYITNRAIMDRLDEVVGPENWRNEYQRWGEHGVVCGLSLYVGDLPGQMHVGIAGTAWVTKWDGAEETDIESVKGGLSAAMKRAAVQWGIGRYLYDLEEGWAVFPDNGKGPYSAKIEGKFYRWIPPELPKWALPEGEIPAPKPKRGVPAGNPDSKGADDDVAQPLSEMPAALKEQEASEPFDATDKTTGEVLTPISEARATDLRTLVREAGVSGTAWGKFYETATGRPYAGKIFTADDAAIVASAKKLLARKKAS
jgi:hypothetical protein